MEAVAAAAAAAAGAAVTDDEADVVLFVVVAQLWLLGTYRGFQAEPLTILEQQAKHPL